MRIPIISGVIDRRILANYHVDPDVMARILPSPFRPKLVRGLALGGICLIRLKQVRPRFFPSIFGFGSENAAHRIAVEWETDGKMYEGVYIPRRDTSSRFNTLVGGTIFPGIHHHAKFEVEESADHLSIAMHSDDGLAQLHVAGTVAVQLPPTSVFGSVAAASNFFELGSVGYSATRSEGRFDGLELRCKHWTVLPLEIERMESSFFENRSQFPVGSVEFDCALMMRNIQHEWHSREDLCCAYPANVEFAH